MKKSIQLAAVGLAAIFSTISLCGWVSADSSKYQTADTVSSDTSAENENDGNVSDNIIDSSECFYYDGSAVEGQLKFQVLNTACYKNIFDAGLTYSDLEEAKGKVNPETGELENNYTYVEVELYAENIDAIPSETCRYSDDKTFRIDVLNLINLSQMISEDNYEYYYISYFSESDECPEHYLAYKLGQGESRVFTIGYIALADNIEDFCLCTTSGAVDSTIIDLNLEM